LARIVREQRLATVRGEGGSCSKNPFYTEPADTKKTKKKKSE